MAIAAWIRPLALALCLATVPGFAQAQAPVVLVTDQEALEPPPEDVSSGNKGITRGPAIEDVAPRDGQSKYVIPGPFRIRIISRNEVPVDPEAIRIVYLRSRPIDVTQRVRPFITKGEINVPSVLMPPGLHLFRIEATDGLGRRSSLVIKVNAVAK
jgi:hypothetical protein